MKIAWLCGLGLGWILLAACGSDSVPEATPTPPSAGGGGEGGGGASSECGNGLVEDGEECEPGAGAACTDDCQLLVQPGWSVRLPNIDVRAVAVDAEGRVFVAGHTDDPGDNNEDPIVIQYNADGTQGWTYTIDTDPTDLEFVSDIVVMPSGDIAIASIEHEHAFAFSEAASATRLDAVTGERVWSREVSGVVSHGEAEGARLAVDASGNIFLANREEGQGSHHALVMTQYDAGGAQLQRTVRQDTHSVVLDVEAKPEGGFTVLALLDELGVGSPMYEPYLVRTNSGGDFIEDLPLASFAVGTRAYAVGPGGDLWWLDGELTRTDGNLDTRWVHDFSGFLGSHLVVRSNGVAFAYGQTGAAGEIRAVSAEGESLWHEAAELTRDIAAGGRTLAWVGTEEDANGVVTGWVETRRIPALP